MNYSKLAAYKRVIELWGDEGLREEAKAELRRSVEWDFVMLFPPSTWQLVDPSSGQVYDFSHHHELDVGGGESNMEDIVRWVFG